MKPRRVLAMLVAVLLAAATATACTGVWNREDQAIDIRDEIEGMPGVSDVALIYDNGVWEGTRFELDVKMEGATDQQVADVAARIDAMRGDDFAEHDQRVRLQVAHWTTINAGADLPDDIAQLTALVRHVRSRVADGTIEWFAERANGGPVIELNGANDAPQALDAVLEVFGDNDFAEIRVSSPDNPHTPTWWIRGPFTASGKQRLDRQLAASPATPDYIAVHDGHLRQLNIDIRDPATAYDDLARTIDALGAVGPEHPVELFWWWVDDPAKGDAPRWTGSALIGRCTNNRTHSGKQTPEAAAVEARIQEDFGCRR